MSAPVFKTSVVKRHINDFFNCSVNHYSMANIAKKLLEDSYDTYATYDLTERMTEIFKTIAANQSDKDIKIVVLNHYAASERTCKQLQQYYARVDRGELGGDVPAHPEQTWKSTFDEIDIIIQQTQKPIVLVLCAWVGKLKPGDHDYHCRPWGAMIDRVKQRGIFFGVDINDEIVGNSKYIY